MSMRKALFVASSLFLAPFLAATGERANAADIDWRNDQSLKDDPPIVVPRYEFSWTGFYLGGHLGYGWGDSSASAVGTGGGFVVHPSGWMGGIQGGYNWQAETLVLGVEVDLGVLGADDTQRTGTAFVNTEYGGYGTLAGRLGLLQDRWLFYLKGGFAFANIDTEASATGVPADTALLNDTQAGYAIGGGAEYAFHPNWSMKVEYLYMDFGEDESTSFGGTTFDHDNDIHTLKVGLNYRFQTFRPPLR